MRPFQLTEGIDQFELSDRAGALELTLPLAGGVGVVLQLSATERAELANFLQHPEGDDLTRVIEISPQVEELSTALLAAWKSGGGTDLSFLLLPPGQGERSGSWVLIEATAGSTSIFASTLVTAGELSVEELATLSGLDFEVSQASAGAAEFGILGSLDDESVALLIAERAIRATDEVYRPHYGQNWQPEGNYTLAKL